MRSQHHAPAALYPRERPGTHFAGGWEGPGPVWTGAENLASTGIRSPDRPARSQAPYSLRYPAHKPRYNLFIIYCRTVNRGPGSSVGVVTDYGLDGPVSNSRGDEIFRPSRPALGPPSLLYNGYRVFPGGKVRPGRAADHSPPSSAAVMEE